ncbi:hypothetical protein [Paenibacillus crassostreae]|uniref:Uncharacterized protein n=1 Tax=Paenibacillus crassostreae TaxID=1763538 RepID=A0A167EKL6_9BACL|nr:hypothetical protein [Paenibacillus crassostreae]AOZ94879.1 hypothetical protein LPB68_21690 [Paenibacillus crassostreae]OAB75634.1 hypothetical protein PNBC_08380 [Paenibacillus crassostreae]
MQIENLSNLLAIAFGVISTIATLVGLIAIFLSFNMQQNVQKLRDIFWELSKYSRYINTHYNIEAEIHFFEQYTMYDQIYNNGSKLTKRTLTTATYSLVIMSLVFMIILLIIKPPASTLLEFIIATLFIVCVSSTLFLFIRLILFVGNIKKISDLPSPQEILNGNTQKNINTLVIVGQFLKLRIIRWYDKDTYQFLVGLPLPFTDIEVTNELYIGLDNPNEDDDYYSNIIHLPERIIDGKQNISSMYSPYEGFSDYYWFNLATDIRIDSNRDYLRVELSLTSSSNGEEITVQFDNIQIKDLFTSHLNPILVAPKHVYITNENTRLKGYNTTKEMVLDMLSD